MLTRTGPVPPSLRLSIAVTSPLGRHTSSTRVTPRRSGLTTSTTTSPSPPFNAPSTSRSPSRLPLSWPSSDHMRGLLGAVE